MTSYDLHHLDNDALVPVEEGAPLLLYPLICIAANAMHKKS